MIKDVNQAPFASLAHKSVDVKLFDAPLTGDTSGSIWEPDAVQLGEDLKDTAEALGLICLGLASNQIWDAPDKPPLAMFIMRWPTESYKNWTWKVIINPEINTSGKKLKQPEGCLSLQKPKRIETVKMRRSNATLTYSTVDSSDRQTTKFFGHLGPYARIIQHEYDHLNGKLCNQK